MFQFIITKFSSHPYMHLMSMAVTATITVTLFLSVTWTMTVYAVPSVINRNQLTKNRYLSSRSSSPPLSNTNTKDLPMSNLGERNIMKATTVQQRQVVMTQVIDINQLAPHEKHVIWIRIHFDIKDTYLRPGSPTGEYGMNLPGDIIKITSKLDGAVQYHNWESLNQWNGRSAYFNGNILQIELIADPTAASITEPSSRPPSVIISKLSINDPWGNPIDILPPVNSLCHGQDQRKPTFDTRQGRIFPQGCTGWTFNDVKGCQLTAGHCFHQVTLQDQVLQMNPPTSAVISVYGDRIGIPRHPHPDYQFAIDVQSVQYHVDYDLVPDEEQAQDWGYFGTFPNPNTGKSFKETSGNVAYELGPTSTDDVLLNGTSVSVTGFGIVTESPHLSRTLVQQTATGQLIGMNNKYHLVHRVDTQGGNSGSVLAIGNRAIGIHTNGGCMGNSDSTVNYASALNQVGLVQALKSPKGICSP